MKAVINRKRYDTETAAVTAGWDNGLGNSDFRHCAETLYQTKSGAWFLHGWGGPLTRYARPSGNLTTGSERIVPLTREEAMAWCEEHNETEALETHFGDALSDA